MSVKPAACGLRGRDMDHIPAGYAAAFSGTMFRVYWDDIQLTDANTLNPAEVTRITALLDYWAGLGKTAAIRLFCGYRSPAWEKSKVGIFHYQNPVGTNPTVTIPKFWKAAYLSDYDRLLALMGAEWDMHPALCGHQIGNGMLYYDEPMQRGVSDPRNRAEMVGGGNGWAGTFIAAPGAGYTDALNKAALKAGIDSHAANFPNTPGHLSFNPYQVLHADGTYQGSDDATISNTKEIIDYMVAALAPTARCVLENNSVRQSYFTALGALITTTQYGKMYDYIRTLAAGTPGVTSYYQMGNDTQVGDFNAAMHGTVDAPSGLHADAVEPTHNSGPTPYGVVNLSAWNTKIIANCTAPPPPAGPTVSITSPPNAVTNPLQTLTAHVTSGSPITTVEYKIGAGAYAALPHVSGATYGGIPITLPSTPGVVVTTPISVRATDSLTHVTVTTLEVAVSVPFRRRRWWEWWR